MSLERPDNLPQYEADLFADAALRDPFAQYRAIRDLGPVVRLARPDVLAIARFVDVQAALRAPEALISGRGVAFNAVVNAPGPRPRTIQSDGARHRKLRGVITRPLMPSALKPQRAVLKDLICTQVDTLLDGRVFDAVPALARHLPLQAVSHLVGLPEAGRARMLAWAAATFNTLGPLEDPPEQGGAIPAAITADLDTRAEVRAYLEGIDPASLRHGSWAAMLFDAVQQGRLTDDEARSAIAAFVLPSLDTTINAKANLLHALGCNPDQWAALRADPSLIPSAVLEGVRHGAVVRWFSRYAAHDHVAGDVRVAAGSRVMLLYGSANRDERHYPDPDRFDVTRNPVDQLGWGTGPHMCVGMHLARIEMEVLLEAMVERVRRIEVIDAQHGTNRGLYGLERLGMRLQPD